LYFKKEVFMITLLFAFYATSGAGIKPIIGIDNPVPNVPAHGEWGLNLRIEPSGWIKFGIVVGLFDFFSLGVEYGGNNVVGYGDVNWGNDLWVEVRGLLYNDGENSQLVGYSSIPYGDLFQNGKGVFVVLGRDQGIRIGRLGISGGLNYAIHESRLDGFADVYLNFGQVHYFILEYTLNSGTNHMNVLSLGYLNHSLSLGIQFDLKDITGGNMGREIQVFYRESF